MPIFTKNQVRSPAQKVMVGTHPSPTLPPLSRLSTTPLWIFLADTSRVGSFSSLRDDVTARKLMTVPPFSGLPLHVRVFSQTFYDFYLAADRKSDMAELRELAKVVLDLGGVDGQRGTREGGLSGLSAGKVEVDDRSSLPLLPFLRIIYIFADMQTWTFQELSPSFIGQNSRRFHQRRGGRLAPSVDTFST